MSADGAGRTREEDVRKTAMVLEDGRVVGEPEGSVAQLLGIPTTRGRHGEVQKRAGIHPPPLPP